MNIKLFYHSLVSDWNHGNAHFLRGISRELLKRGHRVDIYEPADAWSRINLVKHQGEHFINEFYRHYPELDSHRYQLPAGLNMNGKKVQTNGTAKTNGIPGLDLEKELEDAHLVIVHEWTDKKLIKAIGRYRLHNPRMRLLFHDTHHRSVTAPEKIAELDLAHFDGLLAFGEAIAEKYLNNRWIERAWVWHEAADTSVFYPREGGNKEGDVIWIGNWGDEERTEELRQYLLRPIDEMKLKGKIHGVRYPEKVVAELVKCGIGYGGWLPNYKVPEEFSKYKFTVHIPRGPYRTILNGIPTIRPFEAMACGIPLISAAWQDREGLFRPGRDLMIVSNQEEMKEAMKQLSEDDDMRTEIAKNGLETIHRKHSCSHRVNELLEICEEIGISETETVE